MEQPALIKYLSEQGYYNVRHIEGRGLCGLMRFTFTTGLVYGLNEYSYTGRYCFDNLTDAKQSLKEWDGAGDPPGGWIKHKGKIEYANPKNKKQNG